MPSPIISANTVIARILILGIRLLPPRIVSYIQPNNHRNKTGPVMERIVPKNKYKNGSLRFVITVSTGWKGMFWGSVIVKYKQGTLAFYRTH